MRAVFEQTVQNVSLYKRPPADILISFQEVEAVIGEMLEHRHGLGLEGPPRVSVHFDNGVARVSLEVG